MTTKKNYIPTGLREKPMGEPEQPYHMTAVLKKLFPNEVWVQNKAIRDENGNVIRNNNGKFYKPDFHSSSKKIVIEIDGDGGKNTHHYSQAKQCLEDKRKIAFYKSIGYKVVNIPSYIQLDAEMIKFYFGIDYKEQLYDAASCHGFLHPDIALPADFCELGIERFKKEMNDYPTNVRKCVLATLSCRIEQYKKDGFTELEARSLVLPSSLWYLLDDR